MRAGTTVWISRYALSKGLVRTRVLEVTQEGVIVTWPNQLGFMQFAPKHVHATFDLACDSFERVKASAIFRAQERVRRLGQTVPREVIHEGG